jgi:glucokinase
LSIAVTPTPTFRISPPCWPPSSPKPNRLDAHRRRLPGAGRSDCRRRHLGTPDQPALDHRCADLARRFGLPPPRLVNDFAAAAVGAVARPAARLVTLQAGEPLATAHRAWWSVPAPAWAWPSSCPKAKAGACVAGEGGHVAFAPADEPAGGAVGIPARRHGRVTWERVVSGRGFTAIHEFLAGTSLPPEQIADRAMADPGAEAAARWNCSWPTAPLPATWRWPAWRVAASSSPAASPPVADRPAATSGLPAAFNAKAEHAAIAARMPIHVATIRCWDCAGP